MATISSPTFPPPSSSTRPDSIPHKFTFHTTNRLSSKSKRSSYSLSSTSHHSLSTICRCHNNNTNNNGDSADSFRWDAAVQQAVRSAVKWFDDNVSSSLRAKSVVEVLEREIGSDVVEEGSGEEDWDWERWRKHFDEVDEQQRVVSLLKPLDQLHILQSLDCSQEPLDNKPCTKWPRHFHRQAIFWLPNWLPVGGENFVLEVKKWLWLPKWLSVGDSLTG